MSPTVIAALIAFLVGGGAGAGVTLAITGGGDEAGTVAAVAEPIAAATREDVTDAETRQAVATMPAVNLAVEAAVKPGSQPVTYALAAYALCLSAAQGKNEGSAAFGCQARGTALDAAMEGMLPPE